MGAPLTEFAFEAILRDGLNELRLNPDRLDDLFSEFLKTYFNNQYGQEKIDEIKTWIQNNPIRLVHAKAQIPVQAPCVSIQILRTDESEPLQTFSDGFEDVDESITPRIVVPTVTPGTYDNLTGKLTITNAADLSEVCPGYVFVDASGTKFTIGTGNSNLSGDKYINIGSGKNPDLGGDGRIESFLDFKRTERRQVKLKETVAIGCHAKSQPHKAKYLFAIIYYILKSRSDILEKRRIQVSRGDISIFDLEEQMNQDLVYSRYIQMHCITNFDWDQEEVNLIDCFDATIKAEEDGEEFDVNTSEDC